MACVVQIKWTEEYLANAVYGPLKKANLACLVSRTVPDNHGITSTLSEATLTNYRQLTLRRTRYSARVTNAWLVISGPTRGR